MAVDSAVCLPSSDVFDGIEWEAFPVVDAGLLVEDGRAGAAGHVFWGVAHARGGEVGGCGGELIGCGDRQELQKEGLGFVQTVLEAFDVTFCWPSKASVSLVEGDL